MTTAAICLLLAAGVLATRVGRICLALLILMVGGAFTRVAGRVLDGLEREQRR